MLITNDRVPIFLFGRVPLYFCILFLPYKILYLGIATTLWGCSPQEIGGYKLFTDMLESWSSSHDNTYRHHLKHWESLGQFNFPRLLKRRYKEKKVISRRKRLKRKCKEKKKNTSITFLLDHSFLTFLRLSNLKFLRVNSNRLTGRGNISLFFFVFFIRNQLSLTCSNYLKQTKIETQISCIQFAEGNTLTNQYVLYKKVRISTYRQTSKWKTGEWLHKR